MNSFYMSWKRWAACLIIAVAAPLGAEVALADTVTVALAPTAPAATDEIVVLISGSKDRFPIAVTNVTHSVSGQVISVGALLLVGGGVGTGTFSFSVPLGKLPVSHYVLTYNQLYDSGFGVFPDSSTTISFDVSVAPIPTLGRGMFALLSVLLVLSAVIVRRKRTHLNVVLLISGTLALSIGLPEAAHGQSARPSNDVVNSQLIVLFDPTKFPTLADDLIFATRGTGSAAAVDPRILMTLKGPTRLEAALMHRPDKTSMSAARARNPRSAASLLPQYLLLTYASDVEANAAFAALKARETSHLQVMLMGTARQT